MKRKLLTQIKNEWRDNIWMILELTIVTGVLCLIGTFFYLSVKDYFLPRGFDYENVFTLKLNTVAAESPYYAAPAEGEVDPYQTDLAAILERLKQNPNVQAAAIHQNGTPYNYSFSGTQLWRFDIKDTIGYMGNIRSATPDYVEVMGIESLTGKTTEQLKEILSQGELLVSNNEYSEEQGAKVMDLIGKQVIMGGDSTHLYRVADVVRKVRRNDYEDSWAGTIIQPLQGSYAWGSVVLKVRPDHAMRFKEDFRNNPELRRQRNVYLTDLTSLSDTRESCQRHISTQTHTLVCLMLFLLVTIFLGLLGTFWFRIQQRVGEIALRKVCGATRKDVFRRILAEGMILMLFATALISAILWPLSGVITGYFYCSRTVLLVFEAIAVGLVTIGIIASLWYPARKAMAIEPAIALKTE